MRTTILVIGILMSGCTTLSTRMNSCAAACGDQGMRCYEDLTDKCTCSYKEIIVKTTRRR